ncbi:cbb3-type cytochrome c oxidase N-terminal domain-containing protein [Gaoshiqia sp. Z1-71]|uniref:cbb3-type cytochrome c oxidase N-terminal domain-containing protein n=1 Tax=Gaoshiqia hydrogeniformans TaxID=3290090 RepID=UPI003BF8311B
MRTEKNQQQNANKPEEYDDLSKIKFIGGHEYDGIRELDNGIPAWFKYLFYATIVFAFSYLMLVFVFKDESIIQEKEYREEMAAARKDKGQPAGKTAVLAEVKPKSEAEIMADGKLTFDRICSVCHGKFGQGLVGPNMTDEYWIHGGSYENMKEVVLNGVIEKGMIPYKDQLSRDQIHHVITYIRSLQGSNPPNQKAPEGEKYIPETIE